MVSVNLKSLVGKLNETCRRSLEGAAGLCLSRTNYNVEIEHWLLKLLEIPNTDLAVLLRHFEVDTSRLVRATDGGDRPAENGQRPAAGVGPADRGSDPRGLGDRLGRVRQSRKSAPAHLLCALLADEMLARVAREASSEFQKISAEALRRDLPTLVAKTDEAGQAAAAEAAAGTTAPAAGKPLGPTKTPALDQFTIDLTARARQGDIDPVLGRDPEIRQIIDILTRRRQNNPILTGEAGVGKTAVVEGFALRIAAGDVPPALQTVALRTLDLGLLQAGAGIKGEFENRLKSVIDEVKASPTPDHPVHRRGAHHDRRRRPSGGQATPPICSSPPWPAANCGPSPPRPGPSTRSTSRRTRRWPGGSRWSRSRSRTKPAPSK